MNLLAQESSPYLLQHAGNPVDWRPWGAAALAEARRRDCPLLVSIGYAACHWCHVMAHESFENDEIAALMNRLFVCVKIDREERPDIDHIYMSALHTMGEQGGWPLTMFISPDGAPLYGGTYWPPTPRFGRPSFPQILLAVDKAWREKRPELLAQGVNLQAHLAEIAQINPGVDLAPRDLSNAANLFFRQIDPVNGGIGGAPKFPNAPIFRFLWNEHFRTGAAEPREAVRGLLDALCQGGIYDHLGGGFARYSTDAQWHVPHFEKMLYDNAQILELLSLAHAEAPTPLYALRARETFDWLMREMRVDGVFAAAQDADQDGEEGLFYVWTAQEIDTALGSDSATFKAVYDVLEHGNWEGRNVLRRVMPLGDAAEEAKLAASRVRLFALRESRPKPARDDKILADWNGLMIAALARAASIFSTPDYLAAARAAYRMIGAMLRDANGRLVHSWRNGRIGAAAMLDDFASMARAALALFEATGDRACLDDAIRLAREARELFGAEDGSFFITARDAADVPGARPRHAHDGATPSGIGLMAEVLARLWHLTGDPVWRDAASRLIRAFTGAANQLPQSPLLLAAADFLERGRVVVIVGPLDDPVAQTLAAAALASPDPATSVLRTSENVSWPDTSPATAKFCVNGAPAAYVCKGSTCSLPVTAPEQLRTLLAQ